MASHCDRYAREIFIKTDNYIEGVFFADLLKVRYHDSPHDSHVRAGHVSSRK